MIENLILKLLLERNKILLRGVGVLYLERQWATFSDDGMQIVPPFDNLIISDLDSTYNVDIAQAISVEMGTDINSCYGVWCDYLATEAVDGVLTINSVAMIDIKQMEVIALDPVFAEILVPDTDLIEISNVEPDPQIDSRREMIDSRREIRQNIPKSVVSAQRVRFGFVQYIALTAAIASTLYLVYFFVTK